MTKCLLAWSNKRQKAEEVLWTDFALLPEEAQHKSLSYSKNYSEYLLHFKYLADHHCWSKIFKRWDLLVKHCTNNYVEEIWLICSKTHHAKADIFKTKKVNKMIWRSWKFLDVVNIEHKKRSWHFNGGLTNYF